MRGASSGLAERRRDLPARLGAHRADMRLEAMALHRRLAVIAHGCGDEVELDVRIIDACGGADEGAGFKMVGRAKAGFEEQPFRADQPLGKQVEFGIERQRLRAALLDIDFHMILQVFADAGPVGDDC